MKVGFTGAREGLADAQRERFCSLIADIEPPEFHHGCCVGADEEAEAAVALFLGPILHDKGKSCVVHKHPSNIETMTTIGYIHKTDVYHPPKPPLDRNRDIVDSTDLLIACPKEAEERRSGTWATIRYARKLGRRIIIIYHDGSIVEEPAK